MMFPNKIVNKSKRKKKKESKEAKKVLRGKQHRGGRKPKEVPAAFRGQKIDLTDFAIVYVSLKVRNLKYRLINPFCNLFHHVMFSFFEFVHLIFVTL